MKQGSRRHIRVSMLACEKDSPRQEKIHQACALAGPLRDQRAERSQEEMRRGILFRECRKTLDTREMARKPQYPIQGRFPRVERNQDQRLTPSSGERWRALSERIGVGVFWAWILNLCCRSARRLMQMTHRCVRVSYLRQQQTF